jgi:hypothetical protein
VVQLVAFADKPVGAQKGDPVPPPRPLAADEMIEEYVGDALGLDGTGPGVSDATISSPLLSVRKVFGFVSNCTPKVSF